MTPFHPIEFYENTMQRPSDLMSDQYDVLKTDHECGFPDYVKIKAQEFIAQLKEEGILKILEEYYRLATLPELSPENAEEDLARLDEILALAEQDEQLLFLIGEIDYILGLRMDLLNSEIIQKYEQQQACLSEHLVASPPDTDLYRLLQKRLRELGLYEGPIDGVLGKRSRTAVKELQKSYAVQVDGIPNPRTMSILLEKIGAFHE